MNFSVSPSYIIILLANILTLFEGIESRKKLETRYKSNINKIKYNDQLQKFVADCYNSLGDIVNYDIKTHDKIINNIRTKRKLYYNFIIIAKQMYIHLKAKYI